MLITWIIIGVIGVIAITFFYFFNRFAVLGNRIDNSLSQINVQLKRRADLIPNLIETVKGYAKHEKGIIKEVTEARKALVSAGNIEAKVKANDKLESALKSIFALAENSPDSRIEKWGWSFVYKLFRENISLVKNKQSIDFFKRLIETTNDVLVKKEATCNLMKVYYYNNMYGKAFELANNISDKYEHKYRTEAEMVKKSIEWDNKY